MFDMWIWRCMDADFELRWGKWEGDDVASGAGAR